MPESIHFKKEVPMKTLFVTVLLSAFFTLSAQAHCGSCGVGDKADKSHSTHQDAGSAEDNNAQARDSSIEADSSSTTQEQGGAASGTDTSKK